MHGELTWAQLKRKQKVEDRTGCMHAHEPRKQWHASCTSCIVPARVIWKWCALSTRAIVPAGVATGTAGHAETLLALCSLLALSVSIITNPGLATFHATRTTSQRPHNSLRYPRSPALSPRSLLPSTASLLPALAAVRLLLMPAVITAFSLSPTSLWERSPSPNASARAHARGQPSSQRSWNYNPILPCKQHGLTNLANLKTQQNEVKHRKIYQNNKNSIKWMSTY